MSFRVTNSMMVANYNRNQNAAAVRMDRFQNQLATQRKITRLSDDPVNVVKALNARSRLYDVEQFQRNITDARAWLTQTETALFELNEIIKRGYELAVQAANDVNTNDDRNIISFEIRELRDQIATLANSALGDKFIFGGFNVTSPPFTFHPELSEWHFDADGFVRSSHTGVAMYNFNDCQVDLFESFPDPELLQRISYRINVGEDFEVSIPGTSFLQFGEHEIGRDEGKSPNVYLIFQDFFNILHAASELNTEGGMQEVLHKNVQPIIHRLQEFQNHTLANLAEVGGRISRLDLMADRYSRDEINYTQMKSDVEDLDLAEAIMWFSMTEAVYRASLGVGGRILPPSLIDFLR